MTDEEMVKVMEICEDKAMPCDDCLLVEYGDCEEISRQYFYDRFKQLKAENAALRERMENAIEVPFVFNKKVFVIVYDKEGNPYLFKGIVTGIGTDTNKFIRGEIDLLMSVVNECGETHFINGKQYRKQWFCEDEIEYAEARLAELNGGNNDN